MIQRTQRTMRPCIAHVKEQLDSRFAASRHTTAPISHTEPLACSHISHPIESRRLSWPELSAKFFWIQILRPLSSFVEMLSLLIMIVVDINISNHLQWNVCWVSSTRAISGAQADSRWKSGVIRPWPPPPFPFQLYAVAMRPYSPWIKKNLTYFGKEMFKNMKYLTIQLQTFAKTFS